MDERSTTKSKIYVILVNYKSYSHTIECLESLLKSSYNNFQIIIVDNSENDESIRKIGEWANEEYRITQTNYPEIVYPLVVKSRKSIKQINEVDLSQAEFSFQEKIVLVKANKNKGFAAANNVALRYISKINDFNYVWLLNNDTVVEKNTLSDLFHFASTQNEVVGIIGAKLLYYSHRDIIQAVGGYYRKWLATSRELGNGESDNGQYDKLNTKFFNYVVGASMFVRGRYIQSVGLMSEEYFLYYEEVDWALRGQVLGWEVGFCPFAKVYHKVSATTSGQEKKSKLIDFYSVRNRFIITRKFHREKTPIVLMSLIVVIFKRIARFQFDRIPLVMQAAYDGLVSKFEDIRFRKL